MSRTTLSAITMIGITMLSGAGLIYPEPEGGIVDPDGDDLVPQTKQRRPIAHPMDLPKGEPQMQVPEWYRTSRWTGDDDVAAKYRAERAAKKAASFSKQKKG